MEICVKTLKNIPTDYTTAELGTGFCFFFWFKLSNIPYTHEDKMRISLSRHRKIKDEIGPCREVFFFFLKRVRLVPFCHGKFRLINFVNMRQNWSRPKFLFLETWREEMSHTKETSALYRHVSNVQDDTRLGQNITGNRDFRQYHTVLLYLTFHFRDVTTLIYISNFVKTSRYTWDSNRRPPQAQEFRGFTNELLVLASISNYYRYYHTIPTVNTHVICYTIDIIDNTDMCR